MAYDKENKCCWGMGNNGHYSWDGIGTACHA